MQTVCNTNCLLNSLIFKVTNLGKKKQSAIVVENANIHPALRQYFGYCLIKASIIYKNSLSQELSKYRVVSPQMGIMKILQIAGPSSQITLGQEMHIDKASMVKYIDGLERLKYVKRISDKKDRRIKLVALTNQGNKLIKEISFTRKKIESRFLSPLSKREQVQLQKLIDKIIG